jgi:hypothetical protein
MVTVQWHGPVWCAAVVDVARVPALTVRETDEAGKPKPRLLDRVREAIRTRHYSRRTEKAYVAWIRRYIFFHGKRHPADMGAAAITPSSRRWPSKDGSRRRRRTRHSARFSFSTARFFNRKSAGSTTTSPSC